MPGLEFRRIHQGNYEIFLDELYIGAIFQSSIVGDWHVEFLHDCDCQDGGFRPGNTKTLKAIKQSCRDNIDRLRLESFGVPESWLDLRVKQQNL